MTLGKPIFEYSKLIVKPAYYLYVIALLTIGLGLQLIYGSYLISTSLFIIFEILHIAFLYYNETKFKETGKTRILRLFENKLEVDLFFFNEPKNYSFLFSNLSHIFLNKTSLVLKTQKQEAIENLTTGFNYSDKKQVLAFIERFEISQKIQTS